MVWIQAWRLALQQEGHDVIGIFMRNWHDESVVIDNECPWIDDANDAMLVASHLGILSCSTAGKKERIVNYMFTLNTPQAGHESGCAVQPRSQI